MNSPLDVRRFTPPTCTLEIDYSAKKAADKPYFSLSFDDPRLPEVRQVTIKGDRQQLEQLYQVVFVGLQKYLSSSFSTFLKVDDTISDEIKLNMRSSGLVNHQLAVDFPEDSLLKIDLTTVQLFDLITALEAYNTDVNSSQLQQPKPKRNMLVWSGCAVAAIIVSGLATVAIRNRQPEPVSSESKPTETIPEYEEVVPPPSPKIEAPAPKPKLEEPTISSAKKLPPPLPVDAPKPQPDIPDPANYPPDKPLDLSALEPPIPPPSQTGATIPVPEVALEPAQPSASIDTSTETETSKNISNANPSPIDSKIELPQPPAEDSTTDKNSDFEADRAIAPKKTSNNSNLNNNRPSSNNNSDIALNLTNSRLKQVNKYFQEKWQPPEQLKETIEYRLVIDSDGEIARIFPIGKASEVYLDRTNIPLMGESFIEPSSQGQTTVRLMLSPDGEVNTFAE